MWELLFLLLPLAALSGFFLGKRVLGSHRTLEKLLGLNDLFTQKSNQGTDAILRWLNTNQETVETHLTLANLFRRRGEVDKAIGIHQNLISKPNLTEQQRAQSL